MRSKEIYRRIYMSTKEAKQMDKALFDFYGKPSIGQALPLAIQHVLAMIVGCVTPSIIVAGVAGISQEDSVILIQAALVMSALTTLLQLFPFIKTKNFRIGSALPVMMGISFAYVPSMQRIRKFFPPLITGTVVFSIGLSLYPTAINYMAGGASSKTYGSWQNWVVAIITLIIVTALNHYGKGVWKLASILIGIIAGYIVALFFGMVDFSSVSSAAFFQLPKPMHFGIKFEPSACVAIGILFAINAVQAIGDFSATTTGSMDRMPTDEELTGGIVGYGISNIFCAFFGGLPTATYSQNVGIVSTTKVVSRVVMGLAAVILLAAGLIPKFSSLLTTIPYCVLGGATISVFASITMTGIKLITTEPMDFRNTTVVGLAVAVGMGVTQANASLAQFPEWVTTIFGKSPVVLATIVAIVLNLTLPKAKKKEEK